jgi:hypothetical protein
MERNKTTRSDQKIRRGRPNIMASSVDEDLAWATSVGLSLDSSSIVVNIDEATRVLPRELHPRLYDDSIKDVTMMMEEQLSVVNSASNVGRGDRSRHASKTGGDGGVPGFPDFPDCWQGEASSTTRCRGGRGGTDMTANRGTSRHARSRRSIPRRAVNKFGIVAGKSLAAAAAAKRGNEIKIRLREERKTSRMDRDAKLRERRRRRSDMGIICRGLENVKCK